MRLSLRTRQVVGMVTIWCFLFQNTIVFAASNIQVNSTNKTNTIVNQNGNVFDISTTTNVGDMGVNSFSKFNVGQGDIANLNLTDAQNKLLNLIYDNSPSQIDGIVNSYKNGKIGGNILFANSNGFIIGKDGAFNVGSLTLMTPSQKTMDSLFDNGTLLHQPITDLVSFEVDENRILKLKENIEISKDAVIDVKGTISAQRGVDIIGGKEVNISGRINANIADVMVNTPDNSFTTAISDGNNIIIVTKDQLDSYNKSGNTVKISGTVNANGGDVLISAQSHTSHNVAEVTIEDGAKISGRNVEISAIQTVENFDENTIGASDEVKEYLFIGEDIVEYFAPNFADLSAEVIIWGGAVIEATENLKIASEINAVLSSSMDMAVLAINYTELNANSQVLIKSGARLKAKNLTISAENNIELSVSSKSHSLQSILSDDMEGDLAVSIALGNLNTQAVVEQAVILEVAENLSVEAKTVNDVSVTAKNNDIPVVAKSANGFSGSITLAIIDVVTKAIMNADADIGGSLTVKAEASGNTVLKSTASASGEGETGAAAKYGKTFMKNMFFGDMSTGTNKLTQKIYGGLDDIKTRGNASFNNFDLAASVSVAIADYITEASIGSESISPKISAKNVAVTAKTVDNKSNVVAISTATNAATSVAGAFAVHIKNLQSKALAFGEFTLTNDNAEADALKILAQTDILHPLSYYDYWNDFVDSLNFDEIFTNQTWEDFKAAFNSRDDYLDADGNLIMPDLSAVTDKLSAPDLNILFRGPMNTSNFGLDGLYNTYAQAASAAKTTTGTTKALSGAITANIMDSLAEAGLGKGAKVTMKGTEAKYNKTNISSEINNQVWVMSGILSPLNFSEIMSGSSARDGSAMGAGISFNYVNNNAKAYIGENVVIEQESSKMGDVLVDAGTDGNYVNVTFGSANADNSGMSGAIGLTLVGGETTAYTGNGANIKAGNLNVSANIDANYISSVTGISNSEDSIAVGISGIGMFENVKAYIDGTIWAEGDVNIDAGADRLVVNVTNNVSIAKAGTNPPAGSKQTDSQDMMDLSLANTFIGFALGNDKLPNAWDRTKLDLAAIQEAEDLNFDWERTANPDKNTTAYAGSITANVITGAIDAYIAEGAVVRSGNDLTINAFADTLLINEAAAVSANGKSGGGGAVSVDVITMDVLAKIGKNAVVDALNKLEMNARQDYLAIQAGIGVAQAKNSSGAGTIGSFVQVNNTKALIEEGAKINAKSLKMTAKNDLNLIKGLGALAIQAGASEGATGSKAVGGTVDGNVLVNTAEVSIAGSEENRTTINATDSIDLVATNDNFLINADVAGSVSAGGSGYAGLGATNVLINDTIAGMSYADIYGAADIKVDAVDEFREIVIAAVAAIGRERGMGATVRGDVLVNNIKSYIENSHIEAKSLTMNNQSIIDILSVTASGAASSGGTAAVGTVNVMVSLTNQDNHVKDSDVDLTGNFSLESQSNMDIIAATGAVAGSTGGVSAGGSMFGVVAKNDVKTFVEGTDVAAKNVTVSSVADDDIIAVTVGGALSTGGSAYSGSIATVADIGSTEAYIKDGTFDVGGDINVIAEDIIDLIAATGAVSASFGGSAIGAAVFTGVLTGSVEAYIDNLEIDGTPEDLTVAASSTEDLDIVTVSGGVSTSSAAATGAIQTIVVNKDVSAKLGKTISDAEFKSISVTANSSTDLMQVVGQAAVSTSGFGAGGSLETTVINKNITADVADNSNLIIKDTLNVEANSNFKNTSTVVGVSVGSNTAVQGAVSTKVLDINTSAKIADSTIAGTAVHTIGSKNIFNIINSMVTLSASGTAAIGGMVGTIVNSGGAYAGVDNANMTGGSLNVSSLVEDNYTVTFAGGAASGSAAVAGTVNTVVVSTDAKAEINESEAEYNNGNVTVDAANNTNLISTLGQVSGSGAAAVGAGVSTIVSNKTASALIKASSLNVSDGKIDVYAKNFDDVRSIVVGGAGAGTAAVVGSVNTIVFDNEAAALIDNSDITASSDVNVEAEEELVLGGAAGAVSGAGVAAIGASIFTGVINNKISANINNSDIDAAGLKIAAKSLEKIGNDSSPIFNLAGSGAGIANVNGIANTFVITSETVAGMKGGISSVDDLNIEASSETDTFTVAGSVGGAGIASIGATAVTTVLSKSVSAVLENVELTAKDISISANSVDKINSSVAAGGGAGIAAVNGAVNTNVVANNINAKIIGGIINANDVSVNTGQNTDLFTVAGSASGGIVGVGASVLSNVLENEVYALVDSNITANKIDVAAKSAENIYGITVSGAAGGAAVGGAVATNVVGNDVRAGLKGTIIVQEDASVTAEDIMMFDKQITGAASVGGTGVGATVMTNVINNNINAFIGGGIKARNLTVEATAKELFGDLYAIGFAAGAGVGAAGTVLVNVINSNVLAYGEDGTSVDVSEALRMNTDSETRINSITASGGVGTVGVGATVMVNEINKTVGAYTGAGNIIKNAALIDIKAQSTNSIGESGKSLKLVSGAAGAIAGFAGTVLVNNVSDTIIAGLGAANEVEAEDISITAANNTSIYTDIGAGAVGGLSMGAMVNVNNINNTVNSVVGNDSTVNVAGDFNMEAGSGTTVVNKGVVISGGGVALSGGVIVTNIGENVAAVEDSEARKNADAAMNQANNAKNQAVQKQNEVKSQIQTSVNNAKNQANSDISTAQDNTNSMLDDDVQFDVAVSSSPSVDMSKPTPPQAPRNGATSAYVGNGAVINAENIGIIAKDVVSVNMNTTGAALGLAAVGVSGNVANIRSTTEVLIGGNAALTAEDELALTAQSDDTVVVESTAASGGVISGSGNFAAAYSNKSTRVQSLDDAKLISVNDNLNITADASSSVTARARGGNFGGIAVGASIAKAFANGITGVFLGNHNIMNAGKNINISALSDMRTNSLAEALAGALIGGTGADSHTSTGQNVNIEIGGGLNSNAGEDIIMKAEADNSSTSEANSRAYGVVAGGGSGSKGNIVGGIKIDVANGAGTIKARDFLLSSRMANNVFSKTSSGSGALVGINGSEAATNINVSNRVSVGSGLNIAASRDYSLIGSTANQYRSYNDASAYGLVAAGAGFITNLINSVVDVISNANIDAGNNLSLYAYNNTSKPDNGYDLEGGAGGLVGVGSANLKTGINHTTNVTLGGDRANAKGELSAVAENYVNVNEKVRVYAAGGVPVAGGYVNINWGGENISANVNINNKEVRAGKDILYSAKSNVRMFSKADVTTRGLAPVADGESYSTGKVTNTVRIGSGSKTYGQRDVFVEALNKLHITSQIYSDSEGLLWDFGDANVQAKSDVNNSILIERGSLLSSFDKMTLNTGDSSVLDGTKTARTRFYLLFGIPITLYEHDNSNDWGKTSRNYAGRVVIDGDVKSGEGANRTLTIETDNISGNMAYSNEEIDIEVSEEDIEDSKKMLEGDYEEKSKLYSDRKAQAEENIEESETQQRQNENIRDGAISDIDMAQRESDAYLGLIATGEDLVVPLADRNRVVLAILSSDLPNRVALAESVSNGATLSAAEISDMNSALSQASNRELAKIEGFETIRDNAISAIASIQESIENYAKIANAAQDVLDMLTDIHQNNMNNLDGQLAEIGDDETLKLSMIDVKDTIVRSGEVVINGTLSGSGTITAPGNSFSIEVNNNTPQSISFNKLIIENDVRGKIYVNGQDIMGANRNGSYGGITTSLLNDDKSPFISINNNVDAMDPSFALDRLNNAGDIIFKGLVQNTKGDLLIRNLTGDIISDAPLYAKTISMFVPNGDLNQGFTDSQMDIAGANGQGAGIYAGGDITIMARTINVNGIIQSGTVDKKVIINDFEIRDTNTGGACTAASVSCSQNVGGVWVVLEKSPNKSLNTWYLLSGNASSGIDMSDPDNPNIIKAYYDVATGEIILFRAEIGGGDITLIGDVVSTGNGEIRLMSGYGHIDIKNNTDKNLVVSDLNADAKLDGKLSIYDFKDGLAGNVALMTELEAKYREADKNALEASDFWDIMLANSGWYTAQKVDGNVVVSNDNNGNDSNMSVNGSNGAIFTPSSSSTALQGGGEGFVSILTYIPNSWFYELFFGKEYDYVDVPVADAPKLAAKSPINVTFLGYDTAQINISSDNSNIRLNENISAIDGNVNISGKNIFVDAINSNSSITGANVSLSAVGDIGAVNELEVDKSIKIDLNGGKLTAAANNVYLSLLDGDATNFDIKADGTGYFNVVNGNFNAVDANQLFEADDVQIRVGNGAIIAGDNLKSGSRLSLWAKDNVDVSSNSDINAYYIRSDEGSVSLNSQGAINAVNDDEVYYANVIGNDINLTAGTNIGAAADGQELRIDASGKVNAEAGNDVNLRSLSNIRVNEIKAGNDVRLISDMGILNANGEQGINVRANNLFAVAIAGNIENLDVDLDGTLEAYAGYRNQGGGWVLENAASNIIVNQVSKKYSEEDVQGISEEDVLKLKDLNLAHIQAQKMFLNGERNIINAGSGMTLLGSDAVLTATNGSIGDANDFITVDLTGTLSAYAKDGVFVESPDQDLRIFEIMGIEDKEVAEGVPTGADSLNMVHLKSGRNILDGNGEVYTENGENTLNEKYNIIAKNITLEAIGTIGTDYEDLDIYTTEVGEEGLRALGNDIFVSSMHSLIVESINVAGDAYIQARHYNEDGKDVWEDVIINDLTGNGNVTVIAENAAINNALIGGVFNGYVNDTITLSSSGDINLGIIEGINQGFANSVNIIAEGSIVNALSGDGDNIRAKDADIAAENAGASDKALILRVPSDGGSLDLAAEGSAYIDVVGDGPLTIGNLTADTAVVSTAENTIIDNAQVGNLDMDAAKDLTIGSLLGDTANITAGGDVNIGDAILNDILNVYSDNTISVGSSGDLNLGTIGGLNDGFSKEIILDVAGDINSAAQGDSDNLRTGKLDIKAKNIGEKDNQIILRIPDDGGFIDMAAENEAYLKIVGNGNAEFGNLQGKTISLDVPSDLVIDSIVADNLYLTSGSKNVSIIEALIKDYGEIKSLDKLVIIDNNNLAPRYDANAQIYAPGEAIGLILDETQNIQTAFENVTRHNRHNIIQGKHSRRSMNSSGLQDLHLLYNDRHMGIAQIGFEYENSLLRWNDYHNDGSLYKNIWKKYIENWLNVSDTEALELSIEDNKNIEELLVFENN